MAVRARFYAPFARYLAELGIAALIFDYRGIGASRPDGSLRWDQITPQNQKAPLPPGEPVPSDFAACQYFFPG